MRLILVAAAFAAALSVSACGAPQAENERETAAAAKEQRELYLKRAEANKRLMDALSGDDENIFLYQMNRIRELHSFNLSANASEDQLERARSERFRVQSAKANGLPETASWDQITKVDDDVRRKEEALDLGLPASASEADIVRVREQKYATENEKSRMAQARQFGLPDMATWKEIEKLNREARRREAAKDAGLSPTASWQEISRKYEADPELQRRRIKNAALARARADQSRAKVALESADRRIEALENGLPENATAAELRKFHADRVRRYASANLGLREHATWTEIYEATQNDDSTT